MEKIVYWIGVYAICVTIHESIGYLKYEYDRREKPLFRRNDVKETNKSKDSDSKPLDRIGF